MLLALDASVAVVFRRGPTKLVNIFFWNRENDRFKRGQRFKGRIFVDRSSLSPDGRHMIYFAMGGVSSAIGATRGTWTAISRAPSLTAIALWGQGDTWGGGGMFTSNNSYWLDANDNTFLIRDSSGLRRDVKPPAYSRMERDGWICKYDSGSVFEKAIPKGWILRKIIRHGRPERHELEQTEDHTKLLFPEWEWAEWDRKRLVWAEAGRLRAASLKSHELGTVRTLHDFNDIPQQTTGESE